jgi:hypothetical protein
MVFFYSRTQSDRAAFASNCYPSHFTSLAASSLYLILFSQDDLLPHCCWQVAKDALNYICFKSREADNRCRKLQRPQSSGLKLSKVTRQQSHTLENKFISTSNQNKKEGLNWWMSLFISFHTSKQCNIWNIDILGILSENPAALILSFQSLARLHIFLLCCDIGSVVCDEVLLLSERVNRNQVKLINIFCFWFSVVKTYSWWVCLHVQASQCKGCFCVVPMKSHPKWYESTRNNHSTRRLLKVDMQKAQVLTDLQGLKPIYGEPHNNVFRSS